MMDWVHSSGHCLVSHILWQIAVNRLMRSDPACFKSSARTLSTPGDLPAFSDYTPSSTSSFIIGASPDSQFVLMPLSNMLVSCLSL